MRRIDISKTNNVRSESFYAILLFALSPIFTLFLSIRNHNKALFLNIIMLFVMYYGFTIAIKPGMDAYAYGEVIKFNNIFASDFADIVEDGYINRGGDYRYEYFDSIIIYLVSRISGDYNIFYAVIGLIFGFFYSRNIGYAISVLGGRKLQYIDILLLVTFALIMPFWEMVGVRFWIAGQMFVYGLMRFYYKKDVRGYIYIILTPFVHYTYVYMYVVYFIYKVVRFKYGFLYLLYILSFLVSNLDIDYIANIINRLPLPHEYDIMIGRYVSVDYAQYRFNAYFDTNWYIKYYPKGLSAVLFVVLFMIYKNRDKYFADREWLRKIIMLGFLIYFITGLFSSVPSFSRFMVIANIIFGYGAVIFINEYKKQLYNSILFYGITVSLFFYVIISLWVGASSVSLMTVFGNPIISLFVDSHMSISDFIKSYF